MLGGLVCFPSSSANPLSLTLTSRLPIPPLRASTSSSTSTSTSNFPLASRIIVRNLSYSTNDTSLKNKFSNFGEVVEVKLVRDETGKRSKGFAFVQYTSLDDAMLALENMDRKFIDGRMVYVEIARPVTNTFGAYPRTSGPPRERTP